MPEQIVIEPPGRTSAQPPRRRWRFRFPENWRPGLYLPRGTLPRIALALLVVAVLGFTIVYVSYARVVDRQIGPSGIQIGSMIYSTPWVLERGETISERDVIKYLQRAGYRENGESRIGQYRRTPEGLEITTGPDSYFQSHTAVLQFAGSRVHRIISKANNQESSFIQLEPELITNLVQGEREKRRPVIYSDLPKHLVQALIATEDKRFFDHSGLDFLRIAKAVYVDLKERRKEQGASTLTMQLARSFWLGSEKTWRRKLSEVMIAAELERRFSKEKILELYANEVYLGQYGSFSIHGFSQAARSYFNKDVGQLTLPEAALLVGMIQRPAYFNPFKYPERAKARRDLVLTLMFNNGYIDAQQMSAAQATPIRMNPGESEASDAPYFVDLMNGEIEAALGRKLGAGDAYRVYTSLDLALQREAVESVRVAMQEVDKNVRAKRGRKKAGPLPEVALVALDPHTGAVRALVGGRSYADSQLNRALAKRPPGSSFKPFVYAAALNTALERRNNVITAATTVLDAPTVFRFNGEDYEPGNFGDRFFGTVTLRQALMRSLNIPTIKVAEKTGYDNVVKLARAAGMNDKMLATPALALGAYEVTPLEIASAYTIFTNGGVHVKQSLVGSIRDRRNRIIYTAKPHEREALDPRVAFMMVNMLEDVIRAGTAASVRGRGFKHPAAGKTGTSRDGWFAGFTSNLLTIVWIGYDDYSDLNMEGSKSALPVWTEFMKRAHSLPHYRDTKPFAPPPGVVKVTIDPHNGLRASEGCDSRVEYFIDGTQPRGYSDCNYDLYEDEYGLRPVAEQRREGFFRRVWGIFR